MKSPAQTTMTTVSCTADAMNPLPADVFSDILSRLPPLCLAVSRCVCKTWCAAVDDRSLLRADLLPISMSGIFFVTMDPELPAYFSRPPYEQNGASFDYLGQDRICLEISDHCNGLLLAENLVINPATRQWTSLPPPPSSPRLPPGIDYYYKRHEYLVFDPATSPHYEVFRIHSIVSTIKSPKEGVEWPPSPYVLCVFSSRTRQWEMKPFIREGEAAGAITDMQSMLPWSQYSAFWRGAVYVQQHDFITRINISNNKYRITKLPKGTFSLETNTICPSHYRLGKSKQGVYCALVIGDYMLLIWYLNELCGEMEWTLKTEVNLEPLLANYPGKNGHGPWKQDYNMSRKAPMEEELEWDSDDDNITGTQERTEDTPPQYGVSIVGFHPTKEIVFLLRLDEYIVLAYHVNSSKIEDLGELSVVTSVCSSFPFTPCHMGELSNNK